METSSNYQKLEMGLLCEWWLLFTSLKLKSTNKSIFDFDIASGQYCGYSTNEDVRITNTLLEEVSGLYKAILIVIKHSTPCMFMVSSLYTKSRMYIRSQLNSCFEGWFSCNCFTMCCNLDSKTVALNKKKFISTLAVLFIFLYNQPCVCVP